jgi:hypothetical protein
MKRLMICTLFAFCLWLSLGVDPAYAAEHVYTVQPGDSLT